MKKEVQELKKSKLATKNNISILGCGWLGLPLALELVASRYVVKGSTTSADKLETLRENRIEPYHIILRENGVEGDIQNFLAGTTTLIIDVPPKLRQQQAENFTSKMNNLIPFIEISGVKNVLFISSTSVYPENVDIAIEDIITVPDSQSGKQLLETENLFRKNTKFKTTVLRFGGLVSEDRHPIFQLSGKQDLKAPNAFINLIHRNDCIGIIKSLLEQNVWDEIFNGVAPFHPTRKNYYCEKAAELGLPLPSFEQNQSLSGKLVSCEKLIRKISYEFAHPQL